ncbi:MAG: adenylate/guanylate cyclase domain-containing protein [Pseudooceanicola sp.]|nr:adenylate/guanylate cyclase domain-containing protein [Pseudooceanicola sp.]
MPLACVLISDITGSTQLYDREGGAVAAQYIEQVVARMRAIIAAAGGHCVKSKGDDTISFFHHPDYAFEAAWAMVNEPWDNDMSIHAGMYSGEVVHQEASIFGAAVNTAARLSSLAKPGEILLGDNCYDDLAATHKKRLQPIGELLLKGKDAPTKVYAASIPSLAATTVVFARGTSRARASQTETVELTFGGRSWHLVEGETLSIGRSADCDIVLDHAWVSRRHGEFTIRQSQLEYADHSSAGSTVLSADGKELSVHRRSTMLSGSGRVLLGPRETADDSCSVGFVAYGMNVQAS